jgi:uncharacterized membrane protein
MSKAALFLAALLAIAPLRAHEHHEPAVMATPVAAAKAAGTAVAGVAKDAKDVAGSAAQAVGGAVNKGEAVVQAVPWDLLKEGATSHMHNKLVHFPVALGIFGCLFVIAALKWPNLMTAARILLGSAIVLGYAAVRTGRMQAEEFFNSSYRETLHMHADIARNSLWFLLAVLILTWLPSLKKVSWIVAVLAIAGLILAGGLGGVLANAQV